MVDAAAGANGSGSPVNDDGAGGLRANAEQRYRHEALLSQTRPNHGFLLLART